MIIINIIKKKFDSKIKLVLIKKDKINLFLKLIFLIIIFFKIYYKKLNKFISPKISIFIPVYNKEKFLERLIKSIQIQTLKDLEIIAINDFSKDNSFYLLKNLSKKDSRIKIFNNDMNRGLLYSRAMGILNSTGDYLMNMDADDELVGPDNLEYLYNLVKKKEVDFIKFKITRKKIPVKKYINKEIILYQPHIFESINDYFIWNKLVKKELYLKIYHFFKNQIYGSLWNYAEDEIWSTLIYKYSNSMIYTNKVIYIYYNNTIGLMNLKNYYIYLKNLIYWNKMFEKIYKNANKNYIKKHIKRLLNILRKSKFIQNIKNNNELKINYYYIFINIIKNYNYSLKIIKKLNFFLL